MTRETKIGLLVGMGFIVLFGIILSEAGSRRRDMMAPQYAATDAVAGLAPRADIAVLAQESSGLAAEPKRRPEPAGARVFAARQRAPENTARHLAASPPEQPTATPAFERVAQPAVEPVAVLEPEPEPQEPKATPADPVIPPALPAPALKTYVVRENDNLTKIARTVLGTGSPEAIQAIYQANRDELENINHLRVGQKLRIPQSLDGAADDSANRRASDRTPRADNPKPADPPCKWYQIKKNDTWSSIARHQLGDRARWHELYELNRGKFPDPNRIRPGVRIKLPADASG